MSLLHDFTHYSILPHQTTWVNHVLLYQHAEYPHLTNFYYFYARPKQVVNTKQIRSLTFLLKNKTITYRNSYYLTAIVPLPKDFKDLKIFQTYTNKEYINFLTLAKPNIIDKTSKEFYQQQALSRRKPNTTSFL
jgi:hypothetical protein